MPLPPKYVLSATIIPPVRPGGSQRLSEVAAVANAYAQAANNAIFSDRERSSFKDAAQFYFSELARLQLEQAKADGMKVDMDAHTFND
jgi:hypothetical protein